MMVSEKIPGVVCTVACLASVLMGFVFGYLFVSSAEQTLAYTDDDAAIVYRAEFTPVGYGYHDYSYNNQDCEQAAIDPYNRPGSTDDYLYVITTLDGFIVVYHASSNGGTISVLTDIVVEVLAPEDQERLAHGIRIYSEEELALFLQDFGS